MRIAYAENIASLAETALKFLEMAQLDYANQENNEDDDSPIRSKDDFFAVLKSETNIAPVMAWSKPRKPVCLVLRLLTNQLAGFPVPILFRFAYFCHAFPVNKYP